jgi:hypothetical protein
MAATDLAPVLATATFATTSFVLLVVTALHLHGTLTDALQRSNTLFGVIAFFTLWGTTWFSTRYGIGQMRSRGEVSTADAFGWTSVAGGLNGVLVWWAIVLVLLAAGSAGGGGSLRSVGGLLLLALPFGSLFAFATGVVVGCLYAVLNGAASAASSLFWAVLIGPPADQSSTLSVPPPSSPSAAT